MLLKLFKGSQPVLIVVIPVLTGLVWLKSFIHPSEVIFSCDLTDMPLWKIVNNLAGEYWLIRNISALTILVLNTLWLVRINTRFILVKEWTYLPALFYGMICSSLLPLQELNPALLAVTFFIPAIEIMFNSYKEEKLSYKYFEAALLVSLGSMFYSRAAFCLIIVWAALSVLRTPNWREWIYTVTGFIVPYLFLIFFLYFTDYNIPEYFSKVLENFKPNRGFNPMNYYSILYFSFLMLLVVIASVKMISVYQGLKIYLRIYFRVLFWLFILSLAIFFVFYTRSFELIYFAAIPVSYILTFYFYSLKLNWVGEFLFGIFIGLMLLTVIMN